MASDNELTLDRLQAGELSLADIRISPETLRHQAEVAQAHGNPQLAENFQRAAELTALGDQRVMAIYEALRPRRSTAAQLEALAVELNAASAVRCAALVREAAAAYAVRNLLA
jgi:propanediol dehydratase small subunit